MKTSLFCILASVLCGSSLYASPNDPAFSWDTVPVYLHFGSSTRMTEQQIELTARLSNFICLEKAHGTKSDRDHPERVAGEDALRIKKANPNAKVLMYWNTLIAWPFTSYNRNFAESHDADWTLRDMNTGELLYKVDRGSFKVSQYNLLNPEVRDWWVETAGGAVKEFGFDGLFMDAVSQSKRPLWLKQGWGLDKEDELDAATIDLMKRTKDLMGPDKMLIYNGFRAHAAKADGGAAAGTEFLPYTDGAQIEHFDGLSSTSKEDIVLYWKMAEEAAKAGKIVLYKAWPDHDINWLNEEFMAKSAAEKEAIAREKLTYPLACYLIGAQENSYFCYGWGYGIDDGQLVDYPEYGKKLGAPKGPAISRGWKFKREFKHAIVAVDLETREGRIQWLEK
ncbi:putative glycoside hydrolase [Pontiella sp.]|uniref:putative glycoside hydrolase n=1 Tax=Pontiella sp. TaxID=2837462 RepID=UPI0035644F15